MSFVNPWILLAGVAAGIPVLFHLWKQKRLVPKRWGAFRLLVEVEAKSRRAQVERWLLLALRMAVILLLVLAFARPAGYYGLLTGGASEGKHVVVVWDNSYSMARKINDTPMFELARERILQDLDRLQFDKATLLLMAERPREPLVGFTSGRAVLQELVEIADQSHGATNAVAALERAASLLAEEKADGGMILLYHDFQDNGWQRDALARFNDGIQDRNLQIGLVHVKAGDRQQDNQAVADLEWSHDILSPNMPLTLSVSLHNHHAEARERTLKIELDGAIIHQQAVTIPAPRDGDAGKLIVDIPLTAPAQGAHRGSVRLSPDALSVDNVRHFALHVVPQLAVLLLDGFPQLDPRQSASFFAAHLLNTDVTGNIRPRVLPHFDVDSVEFDDFDVVLLANVNRLNAAKFAELQSYVERGGGLIYFLGDQVDPGDFRQAYTIAGIADNEITDPSESSVVSASVNRGDHPRSEGQATEPVHLRADRVRVPQGLFPGFPRQRLQGRFRINTATVRFEHPLLRRLDDVKGNLPAAAFTQLFDFEVLDATAVPLRLQSVGGFAGGDDEAHADGYPLVVERAYGAGRILVFTSSCDRRWNDMLLIPSTAPLLLQAVYYASNAPRMEDFNRRIGDDVVLSFRLDEVDQRVSITRPDQGREDVFTRSTALGAAAAVYNQASQAGIYRFELERGSTATAKNPDGSRAPDVDELRDGYFAVNFVSDESDTAIVEPEEIAALLSNADVTLHEEDVLAAPGAVGSDGWLVFILLGVVVVCGECWLANKNL